MPQGTWNACPSTSILMAILLFLMVSRESISALLTGIVLSSSLMAAHRRSSGIGNIVDADCFASILLKVGLLHLIKEGG